MYSILYDEYVSHFRIDIVVFKDQATATSGLLDFVYVSKLNIQNSFRTLRNSTCLGVSFHALASWCREVLVSIAKGIVRYARGFGVSHI
jgi:hypothetical protein